MGRRQFRRSGEGRQRRQQYSRNGRDNSRVNYSSKSNRLPFVPQDNIIKSNIISTRGSVYTPEQLETAAHRAKVELDSDLLILSEKNLNKDEMIEELKRMLLNEMTDHFICALDSKTINGVKLKW